MADLQTALDYLAPDEGGFTVDNGGPTNFGVTQANARAYQGYTGAMEDYTYDQAVDFYNRWGWGPGNFDAIEDQNVANAIFDIAVNVGMGGIGAVVQAALNDSTISWTGSNDGKWGPETLAAVNDCDPDTFIVAFSAAALANYHRIADGDSSPKIRLNGYINRANRLLTLQSGLAGAAETVLQNPGTSTAVIILLGMIGFSLFWGGRH
jgi:lysozyme family protein